MLTLPLFPDKTGFAKVVLCHAACSAKNRAFLKSYLSIKLPYVKSHDLFLRIYFLWRSVSKLLEKAVSLKAGEGRVSVACGSLIV